MGVGRCGRWGYKGGTEVKALQTTEIILARLNETNKQNSGIVSKLKEGYDQDLEKEAPSMAQKSR